MTNRVHKAFTLVEILIVVVILGILAAIVIPQFTNASTDAQTGNVKSQLQTVRNQIELFRVKNNGNTPVLAGTASVGSTAGTAFSQFITPPTPQQPYMRTRPVNPRNGSDSVADVTTTGTAFIDAAKAYSATVGWVYNKSTGEFAAQGFDEQDTTGSPWAPAP